MASEGKVKLNLRPSFGINGQPPQSPPVRLLINHGKPNYTINKSPKTPTTNGTSTPLSPLVVTPGTPNFGVALKSTPFPQEPTPTTPVSPTPVVRNFSTPTRTTPITPVTPWIPPSNGPNEASQVILRSTSRLSDKENGNDGDEEPEFLRAHRKMAAKISNFDFEEINKNRNSYTEIVNVTSARTPSVEPVAAASEDIADTVPAPEPIERSEPVVEEVQETLTEPEEPEEAKPFSTFADQLNELIAKGPPGSAELTNGHSEEVDAPKVNGVIEKNPMVDENGNTLPDELAKLKFDIQESEEDVTVTATIVYDQ